MAKKRDDYTMLRGRIFLTILSVYGLSLLVFFVYCVFTFPEKNFLSPFRLSWTLLQTVAYFIENLIPVHCAAVLLACSLFTPPRPSLRISLHDAFGRLGSPAAPRNP